MPTHIWFSSCGVQDRAGSQDQPAAAGLPSGLRRVLAQTRHVREGPPAIVAAKQPGRFDARVKPASARRDAPDRLDGLLPRLIGEAAAGMRPGRAQVGRGPDRWPEPGIAAAAINRAGRLVGDHMIDRPGLAIGPAHPPGSPFAVALQDEYALAGSQQDQNLVRHRCLPQSAERKKRHAPRTNGGTTFRQAATRTRRHHRAGRSRRCRAPRLSD